MTTELVGIPHFLAAAKNRPADPKSSKIDFFTRTHKSPVFGVLKRMRYTDLEGRRYTGRQKLQIYTGRNSFYYMYGAAKSGNTFNGSLALSFLLALLWCRCTFTHHTTPQGSLSGRGLETIWRMASLCFSGAWRFGVACGRFFSLHFYWEGSHTSHTPAPLPCDACSIHE